MVGAEDAELLGERFALRIDVDAEQAALRHQAAEPGAIVFTHIRCGARAAFEQCGFRNGTDTNSIEVKHLYVDFRVPQLPIGNRWRLGGMPLYVTPLHGQSVMHGDMGGGDWLLNFTDQVALHLYYVQFEENTGASDTSFPGMPIANQFGEDYATGMTLRLKPIDGLDLHIPFVYGHLQLPSNSMTSQSGPGILSPQYFTNVTTESRFYVGFDSRYRIGNTSIEPNFIYLLGTRNFNASSAAVTGITHTITVPQTDTTYTATFSKR